MGDRMGTGRLLTLGLIAGLGGLALGGWLLQGEPEPPPAAPAQVSAREGVAAGRDVKVQGDVIINSTEKVEALLEAKYRDRLDHQDQEILFLREQLGNAMTALVAKSTPGREGEIAQAMQELVAGDPSKVVALFDADARRKLREGDNKGAAQEYAHIGAFLFLFDRPKAEERYRQAVQLDPDNQAAKSGLQFIAPEVVLGEKDQGSASGNSSTTSAFTVVPLPVKNKPDFVVDYLYLEEGASIKAGTRVHPHCFVRNVGNAPSPSPMRIAYFINADQFCDDDVVDAMCAGCTQEEKVSNDDIRLTDKGPLTYMCCADINGQVSESDENNNCKTISFTVY
jgi:hypothetical protein